MKYQHKLILLLLGIFALVGNAKAAPVVSTVSGTLSDGNNITITGSDFGSKATPAPIRYDDFEYGSNGDDVGTASGWWEERSSHPLTWNYISTGYDRTGRGIRSAKGVYTMGPGHMASSGGMMYKNDMGFSSTGKIHLDYWVKYNFGPVGPTGDYDAYTYQFKQTAFGTTWDGSQEPALRNESESAQIVWHNSDSAAASFGAWSYFANILDHTYQYNITRQPANTRWNLFPDPMWYHWIFDIKQGTPGGTDGYIHVYVTSPDGTGIMSKSITDNTTVIRSGYPELDAFVIGWCIASTNEGSTYTVYYDDLYVDNTFSRVEIGDNADYNLCTHREIQIPTEWNLNGQSITATIKQGTFENGPAYLFVVDENGVPSAGHPITLGSGTSDATAPASPSGLSVS